MSTSIDIQTQQIEICIITNKPDDDGKTILTKNILFHPSINKKRFSKYSEYPFISNMVLIDSKKLKSKKYVEKMDFFFNRKVFEDFMNESYNEDKHNSLLDSLKKNNNEKKKEIIILDHNLKVMIDMFFPTAYPFINNTGNSYDRNFGNKSKDMDIVLIQGAIPQEQKWKPEQRKKTYKIYTTLSEPFWSSDLIVWPETAIPSFYHMADDFVNPISSKEMSSNALFMSGLVYQDPKSNNYFNSVLLMNEQHNFYHKYHLVPFGEYLPFKTFLSETLNFLKIPMSDFTSGDPEKKLFETGRGIFGISICYEVAYGSEVRKALPYANILINVSNDAWFGDSSAPHQHLQIARMRAIENGRYLLRSTNTGISAVIDNKGKIVTRSPQFEPHALSARVKLHDGETPFSKFGNSLILAFCLLVLFLSLIFNIIISNQQSTN